MARKLRCNILSAAELDTMKAQIAHLLAKKGIMIAHPEVEKYMKEAGCEIGAGGHVKIPEAVQEKYLALAPREFTLAAPNPQYDMHFPHPENSFYGRVNTGAFSYLDVDNHYAPITLEQSIDIIRMTNHLDNIDFWSILSTEPDGYPAATLDIHTLNSALPNTRKHGWLQPYEAYNAGYMIEMAAVVAGGKDKLRERPIISLICCSVPTLTYKFMDLQIVLDGAKNGVPLQTCSLPVAGANVPITPSGLSLVASAEVVALILMAQMIQPGSRCVATPLLFDMDMRTTHTLQSSIETTMGRMMAMQLFSEGYGLPVHTYGTGTDSAILDAQNFAERMSVTQMVALSGASILGGAGQLETAKCISPLQLIIDDDIFGMTKKLVAGYEVNDETVGMEYIMDLGFHESFIDSEHTLAYFRDSYQPTMFGRVPMPDRSKQQEFDTLYKARARYEQLLKADPVMLVDDKMKEELAKIVAAADKDIAKQS